MKTTLIVPTMNESEGLKRIMPRIKKEWCDQIIILDGKSHDDTIPWAKSQGYDVFCQKKAGLWHAYQELFSSGMVSGDCVITFSPDGNSIPERIPELIETMNRGWDMVIASRYLGSSKSHDDTKLTKVGNWLYTMLVNLLTGFHYTDALVMYRAYRVELIKYLGFRNKPNWLQRRLIDSSNLYSFEPSLSIRAAKIPLKVTEISADEPQAFRPRRQNTFTHAMAILVQIVSEGLK